MKLLPLLLLFILCNSPAVGQPKKEELYADFDLFALKGIHPVPPGNPDSLSLLIGYSPVQNGHPKEFDLIQYSDESKIKRRKATITQSLLGTLVSFKKLKTPGYEKVAFFADWDYYYDSILVRNDTILYKHRSDDYLQLIALLPARNDTMIIRRVTKNYRHSDDYPYDHWKSLSSYPQWFMKNNYDRAETYTLVRAGDHYEIVQVKTTSDTIKEYEYQSAQKEYRRAGLSLFWLVVKGNVFLE